MQQATHRVLAHMVGKAAGLSDDETALFVTGSSAPDDDREFSIALDEILGDTLGSYSGNIVWAVQHGPNCYKNFELHYRRGLELRRRDRSEAILQMGRAGHFVADYAVPFHRIDVGAVINRVFVSAGQDMTDLTPVLRLLGLGVSASAIERLIGGVSAVSTILSQHHPAYEYDLNEFVNAHPEAVLEAISAGLGGKWSVAELVARVRELGDYSRCALDALLSTVRDEDYGLLTLTKLDPDLQNPIFVQTLSRVVPVLCGLLRLLDVKRLKY